MARNDVPRLDWASKPKTVERVALPFQIVETINESRATREETQRRLFGGELRETEGGWQNKLVWGDNKLVLASLLNEHAGEIDLIYIDPPYDTGADFSVRVPVGDSTVLKSPSIIEEHAYRDTWGRGMDSYLSMMYTRLALMRDLLSPRGTLYLHCDWRVSHSLKLLLDEIFGANRFMCQIIWKRSSIRKAASKKWLSVDDVLLVTTKSPSYTFNTIYLPYTDEYKKRFNQKDERGSFYWIDIGTYSQERLEKLIAEDRVRMPENPDAHPRIKHYLHEGKGVQPDNVWTDIPPINSQAREDTGYDTQKPESLVERIIKASSNEGDLVADFFCGSGTTLAVAEKLGRRWIGCDLGRFAIHTTRKRLLSIPNCKPFVVCNLGLYERQHWQQATTGGEIDSYLDFILSLYDAGRTEGYVDLHGKKGDRLIHVGAVDAPVTIDEVNQVMDELAANDLVAADVLGWEWEMGLHDVVGEEARRRGLDIACRQIPREVMKAEQSDQLRFFELAYLELQVDRKERSARVQLRDFVIPSDELIPESVRTKIAQWSDYIDYWSVDFNFRDDTFHNEWQAYRTREEPTLAVDSDWHDYEQPGRYAIVVKVIDIFGNDTTKLAEVVVK